MTAPARYDIEHRQGDTFTKSFVFTDENNAITDLTGSTWKAQVRRDNSVTGELLIEMTPDLTGLASGIVTMSIPGADTVDLPRECFWDLQRTDTLRTYLAGTFYITREITR